MRVFYALLLAGVMAILLGADAFAAEAAGRVALVIGNAKYPGQ